ncbi:Outer membrane protein TolC [Sphingobacterium psychroaquaticum]|uniref:Outer membrane protein TolC n=2 Tax=Sphingobacterium psychroaquaticum TaxID=561061 RepID=A0A1X7ICT0_9SPHI|nr:Outer membrane protein TolC [Sphingobacterium psychroaquaticum]
MAMCMLFFSAGSFAQEKKQLSLEEVMQLAYHNSNDAKVLDSKVKTRQLEYEASKDSQLPEAKLSGTYLMMNSPTVDLKIPVGGGSEAPDIATNRLFLGQLAVNMPLYTGGKIKNSIKSAEDSWKSSELQAIAEKQNLAIQGMHLYIALYKAQQTTHLIAENIKKSEQQVLDFKAMETNGVIARNDLLKAQLQLSNYKVSYQEAVKNVKILSYQLSTLLGLEENTDFEAITLAKNPDAILLPGNPNDRYEIKSLTAQKDVAQDQLNITKSAYYPTVFATGGYAALQVHNIVTVTNAANIGLGVSYDIGALYKNKKKVNVARQHIEEVDQSLAQTQDRIKTQIQESQQEVVLAKEKQKLFQEAYEQAKENYRIVQDKYNNGVADTDDLLEADVQQLQSQINQAIGDATIVEKYYDLLFASGQLNLK